MVFFVASIFSELLTVLVHFPFDLMKCRLQSKNYEYKYQNLPHAFKKEIRANGLMSLYQGAAPFLCTYVGFICLQFTFYESIMTHYKQKLGKEEFEK